MDPQTKNQKDEQQSKRWTDDGKNEQQWKRGTDDGNKLIQVTTLQCHYLQLLATWLKSSNNLHYFGKKCYFNKPDNTGK